MLNRLYVIIGVLTIIALGAAFLVPRFVQWGDYRERLEAISSEALGAKVEIVGAIDFSLLPQPQLKFTEVVVGPSEQPVLTIDQVVAEFSLLDFLRDRYVVTRMALQKPVLELSIDEDGLVDSGIKLADQVSNSNISVANATITQGAVRLTDKRTDESYMAGAINGDLSLGALKGPFTFQGSATYGDTGYGVRITTSAVDAAGAAQLALAVRPEGDGFQWTAEGFLTTGPSPRFLGQMAYRQKPPAAADARSVQGDLVVTGKLDAGPDRIMLTGLTLQPDENRAGARLQGAAMVRLGAAREFEAALTGGVYALAPRDATEQKGPESYELIRLLGELPPPPVPALPGKLTLEIADFNLRGISVRNLALEARHDGTAWQVGKLAGTLAGGAALTVAGTLDIERERPRFAGDIRIETTRLDALATLWRKPAENNPLFNMPGALDGRVTLQGQTLRLDDGTLTLEGVAHALAFRLDFGAERKIAVTAGFGALDAVTSPALLALLPAIDDQSAALSFPSGQFDLTARAMVLDGIEGRELALAGSWGQDGLSLTRIAADDLGGIGFDGAVDLAGPLSAPRVHGDGGLIVSDASAPGLAWLYDRLAVSEPLRRYLSGSFPADLTLTLSPPDGDGGQTLAVIGTLGAGRLTLDARLGQGIVQLASGPISADLTLASSDPGALTAQLGLGTLSLVPLNSEMTVTLGIEGTAGGRFATALSLTGGTDSLAFDGDVEPGDLSAPKGSGTIRFALTDVSTLAQALLGDGIYVPPLDGNGRITFQAGKTLALAGITGKSDGVPFQGDFQVGFDQGRNTVSGLLTLDRVDVAGLAAVLGGPSALLPGAETWPDGPFSIGEGPRPSSGRVGVTAAAIVSGSRVLASDARFDFDWDATNLRLRDLTATVGGGQVTAAIGLCCAGGLVDKQLSARAVLTDVALDALVPAPVGAVLEGRVSATLRVEATGGSYAALAGALTGEGSYGLRGLAIAGFDPGVFAAVAKLPNIVDLEAAALTEAVTDNLSRGPFTAPEISGGIAIAGGTLRLANVAAETQTSRLFGGLTIKASTLALGGSFALTPIGIVDAAGLIGETTAGVTAALSGTLLRPQRQLDINAMVDAIKVRALEIELDRLEQLQAEDEARRKAAAEEKARIAAEQEAARKAAEKAAEEEAARKAREQEEARKALEAEANRLAAEAAAQAGAQEEAPASPVQP